MCDECDKLLRQYQDAIAPLWKQYEDAETLLWKQYLDARAPLHPKEEKA